ncbi:hypothetical protein B0O99DRAFT_242563 [Bisporella sp. PMI_857]|nr:hypothetical protein B0O99DRAFT_242563 [Bisporella sp. PMI_857]
MCQLTPTIFPCCSRTYVIVKRLSTCPEDWPKQKCPPELCLQTGGAVPGREDRRAQGVCWRCQACWAGKSPQDTEAMRPAFDRAPQVEGLEETTPTERRLRAEKRGHCWFCGNKNPRLKRCNMCDIKPFLTPAVITKLRSAGNRASRMSGGDRIQRKRPSADHHGMSKRLKVEHFDEVDGDFGDEDMGIHGRAVTPDPDENPYGTDPTTYQTPPQRQQSRAAFGHHQDQVLGGDADGIDLHTGGHQRQITYA